MEGKEVSGGSKRGNWIIKPVLFDRQVMGVQSGLL